MVSNNSRNSDLSSTEPHSISDRSQRNHNNNSSTMAVDGHLRSSNRSSESTLLGAQITVIDAPADVATTPKTVEDVWREIVSGNRKECKQEAPDELITLEDFLARAGASMEDADDVDVKVKVSPTEQRWSDRSIFALDPISQGSFQATEGSIIGFGNGAVEVISGRGKRPRSVLEPLDRAAQQRQRRMIKNRESAARSRERKQAYQVELESLAVRLENENMKLLKEKVERTKKRFKQLMEKVVPVVEKQGSARVLRRVRSLQW